MLGLYIHIPFCAVKCAYCDFYSLNYNSSLVSKYVETLCKRIKNIDKVFDTVYFGGGTPSLIGAENINKILGCVNFREDAEITVEVNPKSYKSNFFKKIYEGGVNRISIGAQSANDNELKLLTRKHNFDDVKRTVSDAKEAGFENISLDIMIGIEQQNISSLENTLSKCIELKPTHISCYMLKIEENTGFYNLKLNLPSEEEVSNMYLFLCDYLEKEGYNQYEISNFSRENRESKHNLLYWECEDYIGLGPAAHSFIEGKGIIFRMILITFWKVTIWFMIATVVICTIELCFL